MLACKCSHISPTDLQTNWSVYVIATLAQTILVAACHRVSVTVSIVDIDDPTALAGYNNLSRKSATIWTPINPNPSLILIPVAYGGAKRFAV